MAQITRRQKELVARNQRTVVEHLLTHPCVECGEDDIVVLEFDHVKGEKIGNVSALIRSAETPKLRAEIAKCEVVCANCHRRRTTLRLGAYRTDVGRLGLEPRTTTD
jgi:hypothetical protein